MSYTLNTYDSNKNFSYSLFVKELEKITGEPTSFLLNRSRDFKKIKYLDNKSMSLFLKDICKKSTCLRDRRLLYLILVCLIMELDGYSLFKSKQDIRKRFALVLNKVESFSVLKANISLSPYIRYTNILLDDFLFEEYNSLIETLEVSHVGEVNDTIYLLEEIEKTSLELRKRLNFLTHPNLSGISKKLEKEKIFTLLKYDSYLRHLLKLEVTN